MNLKGSRKHWNRVQLSRFISMKHIQFVMAALLAGVAVLGGPVPLAYAATYAVTNTSDSGAGSLRQAILDANANSGLDTITFNIPNSGPHTIQPLSALPAITDSVIIDGYTQTGASPNTNPISQGSNAVLMIELDGSKAWTSSVQGLYIVSGNSTIKGLAINRFSGHGVYLSIGGGNVIEGNFIGTDVFGTADRGNTWHGISVSQSIGNTIGGTTNGARNVISGNNSFGIAIGGGGAVGNVIQGNFIGTDVTGTVDLGNATVGIGNASSNTTIGGTAESARNVISGNGNAGIQLSGVNLGVTGNVVQGNFIGTDVTGTVDLGNAWFGVSIFDNTNTIIGGAAPGAGNVISGNNNSGIYISGARETVVQGNFIGTDLTGTLSLGNFFDGVRIRNYYVSGKVFYASNNTIGGTLAGEGNTIAFNNGDGVSVLYPQNIDNAILGNSIYSNSDLGIDLAPSGVTPNDVGDGDIGANNLQNFPELEDASSDSGNTTIDGDLHSTISTQFRLEFFVNNTCDASHFGEGKMFLGSTMVTTDVSGNASFTSNFAATVPSGHFITATATDPNNNTSEFSECIFVADLRVEIDIKPKSDPNSINLSSQGKVSVAILTDNSFDATTVDPATVEFASARPIKWAIRDVDKDKDNDLIFHFVTQELDLNINSIEATLIGSTFDGEFLIGVDDVNIVFK